MVYHFAMTTVFKIPESIADKYHGAGYAMCSVTVGQIMNLIYLRDVIEEFDEDQASVKTALNDSRMGASVRLLQSTGEVFAGMCSCWEFVVL